MNNIKIAVVALVPNHANPNLYLAVSRKGDPNNFGLPGGKVEADESLEEAIQRETLEETGLKLFGLQKVFSCLVEGEVNFETVCFLANYLEGEIFTTEAGRVDWVTSEILCSGVFADYNTKLFNFLNQ